MPDQYPIPSSSIDAAQPTQTQQETDNSRHFVALQKKAALLRNLLRTLDSLVFVQLAAIYYLDTLTIPFLLRNLSQRALSLPSNAALLAATSDPTRLPTFVHATIARYRRQYGGDVLGSSSNDTFLRSLARQTSQQLAILLSITTLATLLHLFLSPPTAGELSRGYLHGGILIDVVGQKAAGPIWSRVRVLALDLLVALLQVVAVCVSAEAQRAEYAVSSRKPPERSEEELAQFDALIEQVMRGLRDHEDRVPVGRLGEERRRRRGVAAPTRNDDGDIEMSALDAHGREARPGGDDSGEANEGEDSEEARMLMMGQPGKNVEDEIEELESGQAVLMTVDVVGALRNCFWDLKQRRRGEV